MKNFLIALLCLAPLSGCALLKSSPITPVVTAEAHNNSAGRPQSYVFYRAPINGPDYFIAWTRVAFTLAIIDEVTGFPLYGPHNTDAGVYYFKSHKLDVDESVSDGDPFPASSRPYFTTDQIQRWAIIFDDQPQS